MRKLMSIALAALLAVTLGGCTVTGSLLDKAQIDLALAQLTTDLKETAGVADVTSTAELHGDYSYTIRVTATADQISGEDLDRVATLVTEQLGAPPFDKQVVSFDFSTASGQLLGIHDFELSDDELHAELAYRAALSDAYGEQLGMHLAFFEQRHSRGIVAPTPSTSPDWDAMRTVLDESTADSYWEFAGMSSSGSLPNDSAVNLYEALAEIAPLKQPAADGSFAQVNWQDDGWLDIYLSDPQFDLANPIASPRWQLALDMVDLMSRAEAAGLHFTIYTDGTSGSATVNVGECLSGGPTNDFDSALAEAIGRSDWNAGFCTRET